MFGEDLHVPGLRKPGNLLRRAIAALNSADVMRVTCFPWSKATANKTFSPALFLSIQLDLKL